MALTVLLNLRNFFDLQRQLFAKGFPKHLQSLCIKTSLGKSEFSDIRPKFSNTSMLSELSKISSGDWSAKDQGPVTMTSFPGTNFSDNCWSFERKEEEIIIYKSRNILEIKHSTKAYLIWLFSDWENKNRALTPK